MPPPCPPSQPRAPLRFWARLHNRPALLDPAFAASLAARYRRHYGLEPRREAGRTTRVYSIGELSRCLAGLGAP
jgi:hypothetical protein